MVLIPKGRKEYRGIGLVEVMWKVVAAILHCRLTTAITYHDFLHVFRVVCSTGTATLEAKLLQQLAAMREEVLYVIFLELTKAYDALDRSRSLEILEGYVIGPQARRLLQAYWGKSTMVAQAGGGYYRTCFKGARGVTQGDPLSPTIFNVVVDLVVCHWVTLAVEEAEKRGERWKEGKHQAALFYAEDGMVALSDSCWLKWAFNSLVGLFEHVGLRTNVGKTVSMTCRPCPAAGNQLEVAYGRKMTREGPTYREKLKERVECGDCGKEMAAGSLEAHQMLQHGNSKEEKWRWTDAATGGGGGGGEPNTYRIEFPTKGGTREFPVEGCPGRAGMWTAMRVYF